MLIKPVSEMLTANGFGVPKINALLATVDNYKVLLFQPRGEIQASSAGVWNRDRQLASQQFRQLLADAVETQADLVVTPEYAMPWPVLTDALKQGACPAVGKLWVLGCESIPLVEFDKLKHSLSSHATVLHEPIDCNAPQFVNPLAYVFMAPTSGSNPSLKPVILLQFKTHPMGDKDHFEIANMQRGTQVYQFGVGNSIKLVSLICSDVFAFSDTEAAQVYDRALIVHIQLNPSPRQEQYRRYRDRLLQFKGDETELICLNWASNVQEWSGESSKSWDNVAASAWYLRPKEFDGRDAVLCANHRQGLYYTWLRSLRAHALFFNYNSAIYLLEATKVAHIGVPASVSQRRGPQLTSTRVWNDKTKGWTAQAGAEDGFSAIVNEAGEAKHDILRTANANPLAAERLLALSAGNIDNQPDWYAPARLDSFIIDSTEIVRRLTFCQDTDKQACAFRIARLRRCASLWNILKSDLLPPALSGLKQGFELEWDARFPHQNVTWDKKKHRATVIYMGEEASDAQIDATTKRIADYLHRSSKPEDSLLARQRVAVWFRDSTGKVAIFDPHRYVSIDKTGDASEFDIGRQQ